MSLIITKKYEDYILSREHGRYKDEKRTKAVLDASNDPGEAEYNSHQPAAEGE